MKILIMIPAFNEEEHLGDVIRNIPSRIPGADEVKALVIDDGSTDRTGQVAAEMKAEVIRNHVNMGLGVAFDRGLQYAIRENYDIMVNIDADGQFDPADIPKLVAPILNKTADFVTASRFIDKDYHPEMPYIKFLGNKAMSSVISSLTGMRFHDVSCGFRAYSREAMLSLNLQGEFTHTHETFISLAFRRQRITEVPVRVKYARHRQSRVASNLVIYGINTMMIILRAYRDYKPLKFFMGNSAVLFAIGIFFESILLMTYITTGKFSPHIWSGFVGAVFFFVAIMFFVMGLLADMNKRIISNQEKMLSILKK
jgi:glycosyltransferase involved in cell wall biosynthesis